MFKQGDLMNRASQAICLVVIIALFGVQESQAYRTMDFMESFELKELTYVGKGSFACGANRDVYAVIADSEGLWHKVRRGEYVGRDFGAMKQIATTYVVIEELIQNAAGEWEARDVVLPRVEGVLRRSRFNYEHDSALALLRRCSSKGKELERQLLDCRLLSGQDTERLACFDRAVGSQF